MKLIAAVTSFVIVALISSVEAGNKNRKNKPWKKLGYATKEEYKLYLKAVRKGWPLPAKPTPKPPAPKPPVWPNPTPKPPVWPNPTPKPPVWPTPTPKPPVKPSWPASSWPNPCNTYQLFYFSDTAGKKVDANSGGEVGDYKIFSGDLWSKGLVYKIGFLQAVVLKMNDINSEDTELFTGSIDDNGRGQRSISGFVRSKFAMPKDEDNQKGPVSTLAITGGTNKYKGASGEVECSLYRFKKGGPVYLLFNVTTHCPQFSPRKTYSAWP